MLTLKARHYNYDSKCTIHTMDDLKEILSNYTFVCGCIVNEFDYMQGVLR